MIAKEDLRAAVAAGIVNEAQAASLQSLAQSRSGAREDLIPGDEPFELFKGFNEIFIVVGLLILASGSYALAAGFLGDTFGGLVGKTAALAALAAAAIWGLSEYFIRTRRMVAPAITLSILWAMNAAAGLITWFAQPFMLAQEDYSSLPLPLALGTVTMLVFWLRFRVPFAMALIALGAFAVALVLAANAAGVPGNFEDLFLLSADGPFAWVTLIIGVLVFAAAMVFDMSDPHRVTRRAAQGFWLHVVAAPCLVNTLALSLLQNGSNAGHFVLSVVLFFFALVAIVIDRRSFLIAAIGYLVALSFTLFEADGAALGIFILGAILLFLGAMWDRIRARVLGYFAFALPLDRLPPTTQRTLS